MTSIVTKRGDDGFTDGLFGKRLRKDSAIIDSIGEIDELNAWIINCGVNDKSIYACLVAAMGELNSQDTGRYLERFRFIITEESVSDLTEKIKKMESKSFSDWETPDKRLDIACRVCRRAERSLWRLYFLQKENCEHFVVRKEILIYFNRLSDYLWILARNQ